MRIHLEEQDNQNDQQNLLPEIFSLIRIRLGHDFSNYKRPTILRRIERRINIRNLPDLASYVRFADQNPEEIGMLAKDLSDIGDQFFPRPDRFL